MKYGIEKIQSVDILWVRTVLAEIHMKYKKNYCANNYCRDYNGYYDHAYHKK